MSADAKKIYTDLMAIDMNSLDWDNNQEWDIYCRIQNIKDYEAKNGKGSAVEAIAAGKL